MRPNSIVEHVIFSQVSFETTTLLLLKFKLKILSLFVFSTVTQAHCVQDTC